jgi:hypothetical protein
MAGQFREMWGGQGSAGESSRRQAGKVQKSEEHRVQEEARSGADVRQTRMSATSCHPVCHSHPLQRGIPSSSTRRSRSSSASIISSNLSCVPSPK